jgi:hypothetical protein
MSQRDSAGWNRGGIAEPAAKLSRQPAESGSDQHRKRHLGAHQSGIFRLLPARPGKLAKAIAKPGLNAPRPGVAD